MDYAHQHRQALIDSVSAQTSEQHIEAVIDRCAASLDAKRQAAKQHLGDRYVFSPNYQANICAHHNQRFKSSAVLNVFLRVRRAMELGRV